MTEEIPCANCKLKIYGAADAVMLAQKTFSFVACAINGRGKYSIKTFLQCDDDNRSFYVQNWSKDVFDSKEEAWRHYAKSDNLKKFRCELHGGVVDTGKDTDCNWILIDSYATVVHRHWHGSECWCAAENRMKQDRLEFRKRQLEQLHATASFNNNMDGNDADDA